MTGAEIANLFVKAQSTADAGLIAEVARVLADDAVLKLPRSTLTGRAAILEQLASADVARGFAQAEWSPPESEGDLISISGRLPLRALLGGYMLRFVLGPGGKVSRVEQVNLPAPPLPPDPMRLPVEIKQAIDGSYLNGTPVMFACVDVTGQALLSLRGSAQAYSDDQLAFWARNREGGSVGALATNPRVTAYYRDARVRATYTFYGRGRATRDEDERRRVYDNSPEPERLADPEYRGIGVIVDLDRVEGFGPAGRVHLRRDA